MGVEGWLDRAKEKPDRRVDQDYRDSDAAPSRVGGYAEIADNPSARGMIDAAWIYREREAAGDHILLYDPCVNLCFSRFRRADGRLTSPSLYLIGPHTKTSRMPAHPGWEMSTLRFHPEWAPYLFDCTAGEIGDQIVGLGDLRPGLAGQALDSLCRTGSAEEALTRLFSLTRRLVENGRSRHRPAASSLHLLGAMRRTHGATGIADLAGRFDMSRRHLSRLITPSTGISPQRYKRLLRFLGAVQKADADPAPDWAHLAVDCGYYDQSHMIRDFRELTGLTPPELRASRQAESQLSYPRNAATSK